MGALSRQFPRRLIEQWNPVPGEDRLVRLARVLGEFKWSSQHLDGGVCDGHAETTFGSVGARRAALTRPARSGAARGPATALDGDRGGAVPPWGVAVRGGGARPGARLPGGPAGSGGE